MTDRTPSTSPEPELAESSLAEDTRPLLRLEARMAQAEAQIRALQENLSEIHEASRASKQRALMLRLVLLLVAFAALFYLQMKQGGP